jgi:hypothetical protein
MNTMTVWLPVLSAVVAAFGAIGVAILTIRSQREKLDSELLFQRKKFEEEINAQRARLEAEFATENSAERALHHLLALTHFPYRSFPMIRHHIGGFESNELRKLLVRAGAVRFMAADGTELWALRERVLEDFKISRWKHSQAPLNKAPESELFPTAFKDPGQF